MTNRLRDGLFGRFKALSALVALAGVVFTSASAMAGPVDVLPGRWTGWGQMKMDSGGVEKVKCVATYFSADGGRALRHNLRCASASYNIDASAKLNVAGGRISGQWNERKYGVGGKVNGKVVDDGFAVSVVGEGFRARLVVSAAKCTQQVKLMPKDSVISHIAVQLGKC